MPSIGLNRAAGVAERAVPDRREQPRLPRVFRASRVDRDLEGAAHERDLRLRLDAREDHLRVRRQAHAGGLGRRHVGPQGGLRGVQGAARLEARPARRAVAVHAAARGRVRLRERARGGLRGRRRDRHGGAPGARAGLRRDGRDRRPRPVPADRAGRAGDGHEPRDHRDEGVRPRRRDRPLRDRAGADPGLRRAEGRHLGQHPRRSGHRREDRLAAAPGARRPRGRARQHRQDLRRQAQGEPHEPRRGRAHLEDSSPRRSATSTWRASTSTTIAAREPDRSRLRETFREFELRAPLERLEEALGEGEAAAPAERAEEVDAHARRARCRSPSSASLEGELVALAARAAAARRRAGRPGDARRGRPPLGPDEGGGLRGRRGAGRGGRDPHRSHDGARRAADRHPRLEDHGR